MLGIKHPFTATASFTRPDNTTAYVDKDSVSDSASAPTPMTFSSIGELQGILKFETIEIHEAVLRSTNGASSFAWHLFLFNALPTATNDNAALSISDADMLNAQCSISSTENLTAGVSHLSQYVGEKRLITLASESVELYGLLQIGESYTPISEEVFTIDLRGYRIGGNM